jgi:hypothetical protein
MNSSAATSATPPPASDDGSGQAMTPAWLVRLPTAVPLLAYTR